MSKFNKIKLYRAMLLLLSSLSLSGCSKSDIIPEEKISYEDYLLENGYFDSSEYKDSIDSKIDENKDKNKYYEYVSHGTFDDSFYWTSNNENVELTGNEKNVNYSYELSRIINIGDDYIVNTVNVENYYEYINDYPYIKENFINIKDDNGEIIGYDSIAFNKDYSLSVKDVIKNFVDANMFTKEEIDFFKTTGLLFISTLLINYCLEYKMDSEVTSYKRVKRHK